MLNEISTTTKIFTQQFRNIVCWKKYKYHYTRPSPSKSRFNKLINWSIQSFHTQIQSTKLHVSPVSNVTEQLAQTSIHVILSQVLPRISFSKTPAFAFPSGMRPPSGRRGGRTFPAVHLLASFCTQLMDIAGRIALDARWWWCDAIVIFITSGGGRGKGGLDGAVGFSWSSRMV